MKKLFVLAVLSGLLLAGFSMPASAQAIPNIRGLAPFSASTNFMSLPGYLRWQYFLENNVWISRTEAISLVRSQVPGTPVI